MYYIHTIEIDGQTLTRQTNGYKYDFGVPSEGRKIERIRAELQRAVDAANPEAIAAKLEDYLAGDSRASEWSTQRRAEFIADQVESQISEKASAAKRAQKQLDALEQIAPNTFVWEKASWHHSFEAAIKAARGHRAHVIKAEITEK